MYEKSFEEGLTFFSGRERDTHIFKLAQLLKNVSVWGPIWCQTTPFPDHIPAKMKKFCLRIHFLFKFEVFHTKIGVVVNKLFDLSSCFCYVF